MIICRQLKSGAEGRNSWEGDAAIGGSALQENERNGRASDSVIEDAGMLMVCKGTIVILCLPCNVFYLGCRLCSSKADGG